MIRRVWSSVIDSFARRVAAQQKIQFMQLDYDLRYQMQRRATEESVDYIAEHMGDAVYFADRASMIRHALEQAPDTGLVLQFGVYQGRSLRQIAELISGVAHGFDSFEGLPESGGRWQQGQFDVDGRLPRVPDNVELHAGWFSDTLPAFCEAHEEPVAFMHVDCDLYSSTVDIFNALGDRIVPGTVILFDEYLNYRDWRNGEFRAFHEFVTSRGIAYRYLSFGAKFRTCVLIDKVGSD